MNENNLIHYQPPFPVYRKYPYYVLILNLLPGLGNLYAEGRSSFKWLLVSMVANYIFPGPLTWFVAYAILSVRGWKAVKAYNTTLDAGKLPHMLQNTTYARGLTDVKGNLKEAESALGRNMAEYSLVIGSIDALKSLQGSVTFALAWLEKRIGKIMAQADTNRAHNESAVPQDSPQTSQPDHQTLPDRHQTSQPIQPAAGHSVDPSNMSSQRPQHPQNPAPQADSPYHAGPILQMNQAAVQQFMQASTGAAAPLTAEPAEQTGAQGPEPFQYSYTPVATYQQAVLPSEEIASAAPVSSVTPSSQTQTPPQPGGRFCTSCGATKDPNYNYCLNCGKGAPG